MPRIFRARPAPPDGRSINIGVTMRPVARSAVNSQPSSSGGGDEYVGFRYSDGHYGDPEYFNLTYLPGSFFDDENTLYLMAEMYGIRRGDVVFWSVEYIDGVEATASVLTFDSVAGVIAIVMPVGLARFMVTCSVNGVSFSEFFQYDRQV